MELLGDIVEIGSINEGFKLIFQLALLVTKHKYMDVPAATGYVPYDF